MPETATIPAPAVSQSNPIRADHLTRLTPERSRELQAKAQAARLAKSQARKALGLKPKPAPEPAPAKDVSDPFVSYSLTQCRLNLKKLYAKLSDDEELTPVEVDKIASAIARFSEIERNLAMRPGPGTLKPGEVKPVQSRASWLLNTDSEPSKSPDNTGSTPVDGGRAEQE